MNEFRVDATLLPTDKAVESATHSDEALDANLPDEGAVETVDAVEANDAVEAIGSTYTPGQIDLIDVLESDAGEAALTPAIAEPDAFADPARLRAAIEAVLFVVESPVSAAQLATVVQVPTADIEAALVDLEASYAEGDRGVELRWIAGGVRIYTRPEFTGVVEAFLLEGQRTKLSQAALETLAVIAYRQPVTRGRIAAIRGVNVDGVVRTLSGRGLIIEVGSDPDTGGGLFRTTDSFLEKMGLRTLEELPSLAPLLPEIDNLDTDEL